MLTNRCGHHGSSLSSRLAQYNVAHDVAISVVEVRDRLIEEQKVVGLTQGTYEGNTLLLSVRHAVDAGMEFIANTQLLKPRFNLLCGAVLGDAILNLDILQCRELTKERDKLLGQKHRLEERVREQDTRIKSLELAEVMRGGDGNVERAKARVNNLLREVDRCIALIKREQDNQ